MKTFTIQFDREKKELKLFFSDPVPYEEFVEVAYNAILTVSHNLLKDVEEEHVTEVKGKMYDLINIGASNILNAFAPELELRPNLTTEAILRAEDEIIREHSAEELHELYDGSELQQTTEE